MSDLLTLDELVADWGTVPSYQAAASLAALRFEHKMTQTEMAECIGVDRSRISHMVRCWANASHPVRRAWKRGEVPYRWVQTIAAQSHVAQHRALRAYRKRTRTGSYGRPGVDAVRALLEATEPRSHYQHGVVAALRWVLGEADPPKS